MKKIPFKFPQITALLLIIACAALLALFHIITTPAAIAIVGLYQLAMFALAAPRSAVFYVAALTEAQLEEFDEIVHDLKSKTGKWDDSVKELEKLGKLYDGLKLEVNRLRKSGLGNVQTGVRWVGNKAFVSDDCAAALTSMLVEDCARIKGALEGMIPDDNTRIAVRALAQRNLGIEQRTAMTGTEVPLPTVYVSQIIELVFAYGAARQYATVFPLGSGLVKLPRLKAG